MFNENTEVGSSNLELNEAYSVYFISTFHYCQRATVFALKPGSKQRYDREGNPEWGFEIILYKVVRR